MEETLTVNELAAYWGVTPKSVREAAVAGAVPGFFRKKGIFLFYKEVVLTEWIPPEIDLWAQGLRATEVAVAVGSELMIEGGKRSLRDASVARLHDLHVLVTPKRWTSIILKAVDQAAKGDWRARKWIGDYLMGPPVHRVKTEVEVKDSRSFTDEMRAQAIEALLGQASRRTTIDVTPRPVNEPTRLDPGRKTAT